MELFHTSPEPITNIDSSGRFGEFLCFSVDPYTMSASEVATYRIDIDEGEIIEAGRIFYQDGAEQLENLTEQVMELVGCDEDDAEELIAQNADIFDFAEPEDAAETGWDIQAITAQAAKMLGYRGVKMQDEQGACYMIDMLGYESELKKRDHILTGA